MKYIKVYEEIQNSYDDFIRLKDVLKRFIGEVYPSYSVILLKETTETWSTINIKDKNGYIILYFCI